MKQIYKIILTILFGFGCPFIIVILLAFINMIPTPVFAFFLGFILGIAGMLFGIKIFKPFDK